MSTISTQNGSKLSQKHNIRDPRIVEKEPHIDPHGHHETWHHEDARDAYHRLFDEAVERYNEKQKREDRQIEDYYQKICDDGKKHPVYEMIIGVYGNNDPQTEREILKEFVDTWKERNPNLELIGAYYHADEKGTPHCHIDYIPIARECTRGMDIQTSLSGALREMGYFTSGIHDTAQIHWERNQNQWLERLCNDRGIEIEHPQSREHTKERAEHLSVIEYKVQQKEHELTDRIKDFNEKADYINKHYAEVDRSEIYCEKVEKYCQRVGYSINDYYTHEFWADKGIREHQPPEIYNPSRDDKERQEIREHYQEHEHEQNRNR